MYERYHIPLKQVPSRATPIPKFVITRASNCINCGKCERACIYGVHKRSERDPRKMADPLSHLCKNCFRCIADCPQRALSMSRGAEYRSLGRDLWTPLRIATIWGEAETGKIPVLGAGYRGMFAGPNYDGMWTDMSEIVRPTRDGIHGREYISTSVDLGAKPLYLDFDGLGRLNTLMPRMIELPIPVVFDISRFRSISEGIVSGYVAAAEQLDTLMIAPYGSVSSDLVDKHAARIVPSVQEGTDIEGMKLPPLTRMVEIPMAHTWKEDMRLLELDHPGLVVCVRLVAEAGIERKVVELLKEGAPVAHVVYDENGMEEGSGDLRHAKDSLRAVHRSLVSLGMRDKITIISGGGIAAAEHVPKTIICGADIVSLEKALMIALECRDCVTCSLGSCPVSLSNVPADWVEGRITNLVGAWRDQLLEVMGAMGIREVRRLRGEVGRAIFFDDLERDLLSALEGGGTRA